MLRQINRLGEIATADRGSLMVRYLFGFTGDALIDRAVGAGCTRCTAEQISAHILQTLF